MYLSRLIKTVFLIPKQVRYCHNNAIKDQVFYQLYTSSYGEEIRTPNEPSSIDDFIIKSKETDSWIDSHLRKIMLEGEKDDIFLL